MGKQGYQPEQIIAKLREMEVLLSTGQAVQAAVRQIGVTEQTYYRWRKEYGGMKVDQAKRLKEVEKENGRLRKLVADLSLDNAILKEVSRGNF
jgi:transposase-like protein